MTPIDEKRGSPPHEHETEHKSGLWPRIRRFFEAADDDKSLRAQLEDAIDEHEEEAESAPSNSDSASNGDLSPVERQMLRNLLHFSEHDADDVAIPRGEIIAVSQSASWSELVDIFREHGHSRIPVYRGTLDDVIGMIHIKDVFAILAEGCEPPDDWTRLLREPIYVPQARGALDVLADMRSRRTHLAIVLDEFSGTDGIITIEDLVEEIVGDIEDEHDDAPREQIVEVEKGVWDCDARAELEDVAKVIDPRLAEVDVAVDTLGGLAFVLAEQVPKVGTIIAHPSGWTIEITGGDETHVTRMRLRAPTAENPVENNAAHRPD